MRIPTRLLLVMLATTARAQGPPLAFEVASIKHNTSGSLSSSNRVAGDRYRARNMSLLALLRAAYAVQAFQIAGYPDWAETDRYDIDAKMEAGAKDGEWPLMLQKLLADRFKLEVHREERQAPIFTLVATQNGPKLKAGNRAEKPVTD